MTKREKEKMNITIWRMAKRYLREENKKNNDYSEGFYNAMVMLANTLNIDLTHLLIDIENNKLYEDIFGESNLREYGINGNLRYSAERHTVIMYCEHPAKRFMNAGEWYDITMDLFLNFLKTEDGCNFING